MTSNTFKILDCTLRDGGYYNKWDFDQDTDWLDQGRPVASAFGSPPGATVRFPDHFVTTIPLGSPL